MAKTVSFNAAMAVADATGVRLVGDEFASGALTMAGTGYMGEEQLIGTTTEAIAIGDITALGYVYFKNVDPTNFIEIGIVSPVSAANAITTLLPGQVAQFPTRIEAWYAKADTGACLLRKVLAEL